jgi:hypothetical protein
MMRLLAVVVLQGRGSRRCAWPLVACPHARASHARPQRRPTIPIAPPCSRQPPLCMGAAGVGMFATKAGMMSYFTEEGLCVPATVIALEEGNIVTMVRDSNRRGVLGLRGGAGRGG